MQTQPKSPKNKTPDQRLSFKHTPISSSSSTISFNATPSLFLSLSIRSTLKLPLCFVCSFVFYFFVSSLPQVCFSLYDCFSLSSSSSSSPLHLAKTKPLYFFCVYYVSFVFNFVWCVFLLSLLCVYSYLTCPIRDGDFAPPRFISCGFFPPHKDGGVGMEWEFSPTSWGRVRIGLYFLNPLHPAPLSFDRGKIVIFSYPKTLLFKQTYHQFILFYPTWLSTSFFSLTMLEIGYQF